MPRYRKKPIEVDAFQYTGDRMTLFEWGAQFDPPAGFGVLVEAEVPGVAPVIRTLVIRTLRGDMEISFGDYIVRGVAGEFFSCWPGNFEASHDLIPAAE